jgi:hypothetical protein
MKRQVPSGGADACASYEFEFEPPAYYDHDLSAFLHSRDPRIIYIQDRRKAGLRKRRVPGREGKAGPEPSDRHAGPTEIAGIVGAPQALHSRGSQSDAISTCNG